MFLKTFVLKLCFADKLKAITITIPVMTQFPLVMFITDKYMLYHELKWIN